MQLAQFQLHAEIEDQHWWFVARRQIVRKLIGQLVPPGGGATIVDVGCGTGANLAALAGDYRCVGIDTSAAAVALARRRFPDLQFIRGLAPADLQQVLPVTRLVMLMDVLEHVPDDFALLSELLAAMQPGTHLLITVPADLSLWSRHDESFGHYRRYSLERLRQVWAGLPVTELLASHFNARLYPVVKMVRSWNRWRGTSAGAAGTDFDVPPKRVNRLLTRLFAGEAGPLGGCLGSDRAAYDSGVSLIAVLRREPGAVPVRSKPAALADFFNPAKAC